MIYYICIRKINNKDMKMTQQTPVPTELHLHINYKIKAALVSPYNKADTGKSLILLTDEMSSTYNDDEHSRFTWVLYDNIETEDENWDKESEMITAIIENLTHEIKKHATKVLVDGWVDIDTGPSPVTFLTNSSGDSLTINITDKRTIITLIYSGMY